jgi:hypothetical protein
LRVSIYVNKDNSFDQAETVSRECPHCGVNAQLLPVATPSFEVLSRVRPRSVAIGFRCAACNEPRFVRAAVRAVSAERVELASQLVEIERASERFPWSYLSPAVERAFREALECHTADCYNAFAAMCRRTLDVSIGELGEPARQRWRDLLSDALRVGEVEESTARHIEQLMFGRLGEAPELDAEGAAALIEVIKDMMYQSYVRSSKLRAAMRMRRYFAGERAGKITPIGGHSRRAS